MTEEINEKMVVDNDPPWWERFWIYQSIKNRLITLNKNMRNTEGDYDGQKNRP